MSNTSPAVQLAQQLINIRSITPNDNGCQAILAKRLTELGFAINSIASGAVSNFFAHHGTAKPLLVFSGHTDVVPPGPETAWTTPPFSAAIRDGHLYGRGAADMKSALAAMLVATERFLQKHPNHNGSIGFMITSNEEGDGIDGTIKIVEHLKANNIIPDYCLIGEATSTVKLGDGIKVGRRGSLHGELTVIGKQGHIAYPQLADNPIHRCFQALDQLTQTQWDKGNEHFTPTSFQIYNINADTGANNVIPGSLTARFNFRYAPTSSADDLQHKVQKVLDDHHLNYEIKWNLSSKPFLSQVGQLASACKDTIKSLCNVDTHINTTGGTSDGRFIADLGCEIVELGLINESIHKVNENANLQDIAKLTDLYENILIELLT